MANNKSFIFLAIVITIYLGGLSYDLGVTYTIYKTNPDRFFNGESNEEFVEDIRLTENFLMSSEIYFAYGIILFLLATYLIYIKSDTIYIVHTFSGILYFITAILFLIKGVVHIFAGSTWL